MPMTTYWNTGEIPTASKMNGLWTELQYTQITSNVTSASTTEASPTTVILGASVAVLAVPTLIEFYAPHIIHGASDTFVFTLWEGATQKGRLGIFGLGGGQQMQTGATMMFRYTPAAGTYAYKVGCHHATAAGVLYCGAGGTGALNPAFMRISQKGST